MATITVNTDINLSAVSYATNDTLSITNGATLSVTASNPVFSGIVQCITSGTFFIENTSTTTPLVYTVNLNTHDFRFEKNGNMICRGTAITLGTGDGTANKSFSLASAPLDTIPYPSAVVVENLGVKKHFQVIPVAGTPVIVPKTEIQGGGYDVGDVVFWNATTRTLEFGDGTNGNILANGAVVKIPNIYIHSNVNNATPANRTAFDLTSAGTLDCEWTAFSDSIYFPLTSFKKVRMADSGVTGNFSAASTNGSLELDGFQVNPDTQQTTILSNFSLSIILGEARVNRVRTFMGGLITTAGRNVISKLYNMPTEEMNDCSFYVRQGHVTTSGEAVGFTTLPTLKRVNNLNIGGHRLEMTNIAGMTINGLGICDNTDGTQRTANNVGIAFTNVQNLDIIGLTNSGSSAFRSSILSADDQSSNINAYVANYDCGDNSYGASAGNGTNLNIYNSTFSNVRSAGFLSDVATTFLASKSGMFNVRATCSGNLNNDPISNAEYNPIAGTPISFQTAFNNATDFAYANIIDKDDDTTGVIAVGSFGEYTGTNASKMTFTGDSQLDQLGGVELFNIGDSVTVESLFAIRGITDFSGTPLYTYTETTAFTDSTTAPTGLDIEFRLRTPTTSYDDYTGWQVLDVANLSSELASLTDYDSNKGFYMQTRFTANSFVANRVFNQVLIPTVFDNTFLYPDGYTTIEGASNTDVVNAYVYDPADSDPLTNTYLGSVTGNGKLEFSASSYLGEQFYVIRYTTDGVRIMSTRSSPKDIKLGDNGIVTVYAGDEIQTASDLVSRIEAIESKLITTEDVWSYGSAEARTDRTLNGAVVE